MSTDPFDLNKFWEKATEASPPPMLRGGLGLMIFIEAMRWVPHGTLPGLTESYVDYGLEGGASVSLLVFV